MGFREVIAEPGFMPLPDRLVADHVAEIADNRLRAISEKVSFEKLLWHAKFGLVKSFRETFVHERPSDVSELPTTIFSSFIDEGDPWVLPALQVYARLLTAVTLSNKPLCANDTFDLWHAQYAVPHCHAFFCDKFVAHTCTTPPLNLGKLYGTTILSRSTEILAYLQGLDNQQ